MYIGLVVISFIIYLAYNIYALVKIGEIPHSISQTYYRVPWTNGMSTSYQAMIVSILPALLMVEPYYPNLWWIKLFGVFSLCCLWGVSGAPDYWNEKQQKVHGILTYCCEGFAGVYCLLITQYWWILFAYAVLFLIPCFILKQWKDCRSYWIEHICFFTFYTVTLLQLI